MCGRRQDLGGDRCSTRSADLGCGIVYSLLQIVAFVGVLWALSAQVTFRMADYDIAIPGYMVWCALGYALIGSGLTWFVGRPLIALNGERYAREAEFRFALVKVNESGESIALHGGEKDEHRHLEAALAAVVDTMRRISTSLAQLVNAPSGILAEKLQCNRRTASPSATLTWLKLP